MAGPDRRPDPALIRRLEREPRQFTFFQAVRLLEHAARGTARIGHRGPPEREAVRLRPSSSLGFQSAGVTRIARRDAGGPAHAVTTTLLGLYGASSGLPSWLTEDILAYETQNAPDPDPVRLFLDVLNHRLLSLLYRSWEKYRWPVRFEPGGSDALSREMLALLGVASEEVRSAVGLPPTRLLRYAAFLTQRPKGASALAGVLADYLGGPRVRISQCVMRWVTLPPRDRNRLGVVNTRLGADLVLGASARDEAGRFRIHLGPFAEDPRFEDFLPDSRAAAELGALVRLLVPDPLEYDVELSVRGAFVPALRLARDEGAARLGWTSWLLSEPTGDKRELFRAPHERRAAQAA